MTRSLPALLLTPILLALALSLPARPQAGFNGIKVGDTVQVSTAFGWLNGRVRAIRGNSYYVDVQGTDMWKNYPSELRRIGPSTAGERAHGVFGLHDRVLVNVRGQGWVPGEVTVIMGADYQVRLAGDRYVWANPAQLRSAAAAPAPALPMAGQPPRPGLISCAGKIEGRYAPDSGPGSITITFRGGKATVGNGIVDDDTVECWMGGGKIYLHKPGESAANDMPIDINDDGTLQVPLYGALKKKGH